MFVSFLSFKDEAIRKSINDIFRGIWVGSKLS